MKSELEGLQAAATQAESKKKEMEAELQGLRSAATKATSKANGMESELQSLRGAPAQAVLKEQYLESELERLRGIATRVELKDKDIEGLKSRLEQSEGTPSMQEQLAFKVKELQQSQEKISGLMNQLRVQNESAAQQSANEIIPGRTNSANPNDEDEASQSANEVLQGHTKSTQGRTKKRTISTASQNGTDVRRHSRRKLDSPSLQASTAKTFVFSIEDLRQHAAGDLPEEVSTKLAEQITFWHTKRPDWCQHPSDKTCIFNAVNKQGTKWRDQEGASTACQACFKKRRVCATVQEGSKIKVIPLGSRDVEASEVAFWLNGS